MNPAAQMIWIFWSLLAGGVTPSQGHHIIFEHVGELAPSLSYLHVNMLLNLTAIEEYYLAYTFQLSAFEKAIDEWKFEHPVMSQVNKQATGNVVKTASAYMDLMAKASREQAVKTVSLHRSTANNLLRRMETFRGILPQINSRRQTRSVKSSLIKLARGAIETTLASAKGNPAAILEKARQGFGQTASQMFSTRKVLGLGMKTLSGLGSSSLMSATGPIGLGFGLIGTVFGIYNTVRIRKLEKRVVAMEQEHQQLVTLVQQQGHEMLELQRSFDRLIKELTIFTTVIPIAYISRELAYHEAALSAMVHRATHTLQQLQSRRLAIDFLSQDDQLTIFNDLVQTAQNRGLELLVRHPGDLYQIETTYFTDNFDVSLVLHVPAISHNSKMQLYKLHPFPLPLSSNEALIPIVHNDILAVADLGLERFSAQLSSVDLMDCQQLNKIFLCERQGVVKRNLTDSCLGALFMQEFNLAKDLCPLEIRPLDEVVYKLIDNWYLLFSPKAVTAILQCSNGSEIVQRFSEGISKGYLDPGCYAEFSKHRIYSDDSIQVSSDIQHFEWKWEKDLFTHFDPAEVKEALNDLKESDNRNPSIKDLQTTIATNRIPFLQRKHSWPALLGIITALKTVLIVLFIVIRKYCYPCSSTKSIPSLEPPTSPIPNVQPIYQLQPPEPPARYTFSRPHRPHSFVYPATSEYL